MKNNIKIIYISIICAIIINKYKVDASPMLEDKQIKKVIKSYFNTRYKILSSLTWDDKIEEFFIPNDIGALDEKTVLQTIVDYRKLQLADLRFKKYNYELKYETIQIDNTKASVVVIENSNMYFNCSHKIKTEIIGVRHKLILIKQEDQWKIKEHNYYDEIKNKIEKYYKEYKSIDQAQKEILKESQIQRNIYRDINNLSLEYKLQQEKEKMNIDKKEIDGFNFYGYDINKAVEYALEYALKMNPKYGNYEKLGGDCTNFISQCLHAGKIPFDLYGKDIRYKWYWYSESKRTPSWTAAQSLRYYIENNNKDTITVGLKAHEIKLDQILRGDIIQLIDEKSKAYHSMICTDYAVKDGWVVDYLISQHSGYDEDHSRRLKNYPLSQKGGMGIFWSIDGYYQK